MLSQYINTEHNYYLQYAEHKNKNHKRSYRQLNLLRMNNKQSLGGVTLSV